MKRTAIAVCAVVLVFAVTAWAQTGAKPKSGSAEQELIKLELGWSDALVKHDWAFIDRAAADDFTWTDLEGITWTKAQSLSSLRSGEDVITSLVTDDMKVRIYGDAAVVTGRNTVKEMLKGKDISGQYRWTDAWVKKDGRWQCVVSVASKIAQK